MSEFENILNKPFAKDAEEIGFAPKTPLQYRLRRNIEMIEGGWHYSDLLLNGYDLATHAFAKFVEPMAKALITNPISLNDYRDRRQKAFKTLAAIANKDLSGKKDPSGLGHLLRHELISSVLISTGYLSFKEVEATPGPDWEGFDNKIQLNTAAKKLTGNQTALRAPIITEEQLVEKVRNLTANHKISAVFLGMFDMDHEGQKQTASEGKISIGPDGIEFILVADDKLSILQKGRSPVRSQERRVANMAQVRGADYVCPIVLPESITTIEQATIYYSDLLKRVQPLIRIVGSPSNVGEKWWNIYVEQCQKNDILLLYNDNLSEVSTTNDLQKLRQSIQSF